MTRHFLLTGLLMGAMTLGCEGNDGETGNGGNSSGGNSSGGNSSGGNSSGGNSSGGNSSGGNSSGGNSSGGNSSGGASTQGGEGGGAGSASAGGAGGAEGEGTLGFILRTPQERSLVCSMNPTELPDEAVMMDEDFVCTFAYGADTGHVYVQATPTDCMIMMGPIPSAFSTEAWLARDGAVSPLQEATYDHGGNHFNNTFEFTWEGRHYRYAHSTLGYGGRACQPPDCLQVYEADGITLLENGCTPERTLPVTCAAVETGGVLPALDREFERCLGDPNG